MQKYFLVIAAIAFFIAVNSPTAVSDTIKLKNGDTYKGTVTAEEDERVQMKLDGSGVRVWFSRDQISSLEKPAEEETSGSESAGDPSASEEGVDDEMLRARELLEKLRNQPKDAGDGTSAGEFEKPPCKGPENAPVTITVYNDYQ